MDLSSPPPTAPFPTRLWAGIRAYRRLSRDVTDPVNGALFLESLDGKTYHLMAERFGADPRGKRFLDRRPSMAPDRLDFDALRALPPHSLGHEYARYFERQQVQPLRNLERELTPSQYLAQRMRETHDIHHVLTGYGTDFIGEHELQAFQFGNLGTPSSLLALLTSLPKGQAGPRFAYLRRLWRAWRRGRAAAPLARIVWEEQWGSPIVEVRARISLDGGPGDRWSGTGSMGGQEASALEHEELRPGGPVHHFPLKDRCVVIGHKEVSAALSQPRIFSSIVQAWIDPVLLGADPPRHTEVRRLVARTFSPQNLDRRIGPVEEDAAGLIGAEFDAVEDFAIPLTMKVVARFVGLPEEDVAAILARYPAPDGELGLSPDPIERASLFHDLRSEAGAMLEEREVRNLVILLCAAATETTETLIVRCMLCLLEDEAVRRSVAASEALQARFIEEVMRLYPPTAIITRTTTEQVELGGVALPPGTAVQLSLAAANRDPAVFEDPEKLRLDRPGGQHLAFGAGVHRCIGAAVGRRVTAAALASLLRHPSPFRPAMPLGSVAFRVVRGLPAPVRLIVRT